MPISVVFGIAGYVVLRLQESVMGTKVCGDVRIAVEEMEDIVELVFHLLDQSRVQMDVTHMRRKRFVSMDQR